MPHARISALDGVRGLAILFVFAYHVTLGFPATSLVRSAASWGWMGVDLFFVLSGFFITGILLDTVGSPGYFRTFYSRRVLRIWPAYIACLAVITLIATGLVWFDGDPLASSFLGSAPWYWLHATNLLAAHAGTFSVTPLGTGHFWSLAVEEQFYLLWPLVVLVAARTPRRAVIVSITLIIGAALLRLMLRQRGAEPIVLYALMPTRVDALAWGALIAGVARLDRALLARAALPVFALGLAGLVALTAHVGGAYPVAKAFTLAGYSLSGMASAGAVAYASTREHAGWLSWRPLTELGKYSYAVYIWHGPIVYGLERVALPPALVTCVAIALTAAAAWGSWRLIEQPALSLREVFQRAAPLAEPAE